MNELRVIAATSFFALGSYLVYDMIVNSFDWRVRTACLFCFAAAHYVWPRKAAGENHWFDALELIVDLPYQAIASLLRWLGRIVRGKDGGIDIDL